MGRIRTIKPEFTQDEELSSLPAETHLFAAGLLCHSDDDGYFNANPGLIKAAIFPLRESSVSIQGMLTQLSNIGFIRLGSTAEGKHYGQVVKFSEHQRVNRPTPSKIKGLAIQWTDSLSTHGGLTEDSLQERKGKEGNGTTVNRVRSATTKANFNSTEVAQVLCSENGWSGRGLIWALQAAIEFQVKRMPEAELQQVGEWLLKAYTDHKSTKGKFAVAPQKFFEQGLYCPASDRREATANLLNDNPATRALAQMEAS